jgi:hypothetical protein
MMRSIIATVALAALAGCANAPTTPALVAAAAVVPALIPAPSGAVVRVFQAPAGQLFCRDLRGLVFAVVDSESRKLTGAAQSVSVIATNATQNYVDAACNAANAVPVPPPAANDVVPVVAVKVPAA